MDHLKALAHSGEETGRKEARYLQSGTPVDDLPTQGQSVLPTAESPTVIAPASTGAPPLAAAGTVPTKRQSGTHPGESPAKKQSKWSPEDDATIIQLRGDGMKWDDISRHLPGRSAISCRLHYQNYLERRSEWDEDRKNKLARLYERYVEQRGTRSCPAGILLMEDASDSKPTCGPK
jgi:hypothetical protein